MMGLQKPSTRNKRPLLRSSRCHPTPKTATQHQDPTNAARTGIGQSRSSNVQRLLSGEAGDWRVGSAVMEVKLVLENYTNNVLLLTE